MKVFYIYTYRYRYIDKENLLQTVDKMTYHWQLIKESEITSNLLFVSWFVSLFCFDYNINILTSFLSLLPLWFLLLHIFIQLETISSYQYVHHTKTSSCLISSLFQNQHLIPHLTDKLWLEIKYILSTLNFMCLANKIMSLSKINSGTLVKQVIYTSNLYIFF